MNNKYALQKDNIIYINPEWDLYRKDEVKENITSEKKQSYCQKRKDFIDNYANEIEKNNLELIKPDDILLQLANLKQLTFEVTDACNLKCKYCGYGELYGDYDNRENNYMSLESIKLLIDYLVDLWNSNMNQSHGRIIYISFYGGEPLLNFSFIEKVVEYFSSKRIYHNSIVYSMTTNGILLKKHIEYLAALNFKLLISLDGNKINNSYRILHNGNESFPIIKNNLDFVRENYRDYFESNLNFNSVLHNRNSISETFNYIKNEFNKVPRVNELNTSGVKKNKVDEFTTMFRSQTESLYQSDNINYIKDEMSANIGEIMNLDIFLSQYSGNVFQDYNDLFPTGNNSPSIVPTGTCFPFSKRVFVSVAGKILPCERISHRFSMGNVDSKILNINVEEIAEQYNNYFRRIVGCCKTCYRINTCTQCIFNLNNIDAEPIICHGYLNKEDFFNQLNHHMSCLGNNSKLYQKFIEKTVLQF